MKIGIVILLMTFWGMKELMAQNVSKIKLAEDIELTHLQDSIFIHTSWYQTQSFGKVPANGLLVIKDGGAVLIDSPWDNEMTAKLITYVEDELNAKIIKFIVGHSHEDCMGGLGYIQSKGIKSIANKLTVAKCKKENLPIPDVSFTDSLIFDINGLKFECRYFGGGHTMDNSTVWIPEKQILFAGCLAKSLKASNLGYVKEAVLQDWDITIGKVMNKYKDVRIVIPGHGQYGDAALLSHTIQLIQKHRLNVE